MLAALIVMSAAIKCSSVAEMYLAEGNQSCVIDMIMTVIK